VPVNDSDGDDVQRLRSRVEALRHQLALTDQRVKALELQRDTALRLVADPPWQRRRPTPGDER
jgi:hypothetical protein